MVQNLRFQLSYHDTTKVPRERENALGRPDLSWSIPGMVKNHWEIGNSLSTKGTYYIYNIIYIYIYNL